MINNMQNGHHQVDIITGLACNEKCFFCFQDTEYIQKYDKKFSLPAILKVLIQGKNQGIRMVNISGGEPTIYKDFDKLLHLVGTFGYQDVKVITNGIAFAQKEFCEKTLPYITDIGLSFHSPFREKQDKITGLNGSYDMLLQALENFKSYRVNIHNHCTINEYNFDDLEAHTQMMIDYKFQSIHFLSMMPNTPKNNDNLVQLEKTAQKMKYLIDTYGAKIRIDVAYIQPCFMVGYEDYVSYFEYGKSYLSNNPLSLSSWEETILENKEQRPACKGCRYWERCRGFWKNT